MDRRRFLQFGMVGSAATLVVPELVLASAPQPIACGLYYTKEVPGRWEKKVSSHLPNITVVKTSDGAGIEVFTRHPMDDYQHYIVKHMLLDSDYRFMDEKMFIPGKDKEARSEYSVGQYNGTLYVLSVCNQHDTWLNSVVL